MGGLFGTDDIVEAVALLRADLAALPERIAQAVTAALREDRKRGESRKETGPVAREASRKRRAPAARNGRASRSARKAG